MAHHRAIMAHHPHCSWHTTGPPLVTTILLQASISNSNLHRSTAPHGEEPCPTGLSPHTLLSTCPMESPFTVSYHSLN
eukprot:1161738-Pelagomonas_calceolata.AAC.1